MERTVLIVEDEKRNREALGKILDDDYNLLYAKNGKQAIEIVINNSDIISAILLEAEMGDLSGFEIMSILRADKELAKIPVIVSSREDSFEAEVKALELGAKDYIHPPYKAEIIKLRLLNTIEFRENAAMINTAMKDELTGLYNKQYFIKAVEERLATCQKNEKLDLLCIDIDQFKLINDKFGIAAGDKLLKFFAKELKKDYPEITICSRFGADVFYMLVGHNVEYTPEMVRESLEKLKSYPLSIDIKIRCGVYRISNPAIPVTVMCDRAKLAADKIRGKYNMFFSYYNDTIRQELVTERTITDCMNDALHNDEFHVYYQPKYDLESELIAGAEALVRWISPTRGYMAPDEFIPVFEKNGFITQMDIYVWETVCKDMHDWIEAGHKPVSISVNVSRTDIYNPDLLNVLESLVEKYTIPKEYLHLEITETAYTENPAQLIRVVNILRDSGFLIEMDDFGSGYSSLNMLSQMPIDVLKLDMKFIQTQTKNTSGKGILGFIISLAKWLNVAVVAEGVETKEQIETLCTMECNYVQGFYYARPMEREKFTELLANSDTTEMICSNIARYKNRKPHVIMKPLNDAHIMLVVDDVSVNRAIISKIFEKEFTIVEAENGEEAWSYLEENGDNVEIVMLDLLMPVMDGFQLLKKIRNSDKACHLPVIITSQGDDVESRRIALALQADDFIAKPYNSAVMKDHVDTILSATKKRPEALEALKTEKTPI